MVMAMMWCAIVFRHLTRLHIIQCSIAMNMSISTSYFRHIVKSSSYRHIHTYTYVAAWIAHVARSHCIVFCVFFVNLCVCICVYASVWKTNTLRVCVRIILVRGVWLSLPPQLKSPHLIWAKNNKLNKTDRKRTNEYHRYMCRITWMQKMQNSLQFIENGKWNNWNFVH